EGREKLANTAFDLPIFGRVQCVYGFYYFKVWVVINGSALCSGAAKPVCEMAGTKKRILARDQATLFKRGAEVAGLLVRYDGAGIVMRHKVFAHELVERESIRCGNLNGSIQWFRDGDFGQVNGEVVREDGLKQH